MPPVSQPDEVVERKAISTRSVVIGLAVGLPLSVLFLWLAIRGVSFDEVWGALRSANPWLVLLAVPFLLMLFVMQGLRWRHLVVAPNPPRRRIFVVLMFVGTAITNVVPGRPGDVARGIWLSRIGRIPVARSLTSVGVDRAMDVAIVFVLLLVCLPFIEAPDWLITLAIVGAVVCVLAAVVLLVAWWYAHKRNPQDPAAGMEKGERSWWRHQLSGVIRGLAVLSRPRDFSLAVGASFIGWGFNAFGTWLVAESLGLGIGIPGALLVTSVIALGSAIPSSPGMIGTFQWLAVASLAVVGIGRADALAFSILLQAAWYIPTTLSGVPGAWWLTRQGTTAPTAPAAPDA
jgi:uncharacterized protein (TIRG00374 family)